VTVSDTPLGTSEGKIKITYDGRGVTQARNELGQFVGGGGKGGSLAGTQASFTKLATISAGATAAVAAGIGFAVNAAIDFEKRLSAIGAVSGATGDQLELLRAKALKLGADTVFSASDAAQAMEELAKAGLSVTDILNGAADATVALAAAGEIDLPQAATIAANAMNQFGLAAKDLPKVADLIAGAANASAIDVGQFGFAMQQAGAVAHLVGVNFHDLAVAIALMGNAGIVGSDAGTSLKTMLNNLQPTTKKQIELMTKLGIVTKNGGNAFFDQAGHLKSLADVSQILQNAMKGMTDAQKSMTLQVIFGSDAIRAAAVLAGAGAAGFNKLSDAMGKVTAADVAKARMDNVAGSIEQLKGSVDTAAIALGTALLPVIRQVTDFVTLLVNKFSALDPKWQQLIAFALVAGGALVALVAIVAGVAAAIAALASTGIGAGIVAGIAGIVVVVIALAAAVKEAYTRSLQFREFIGKLAQVAQGVFGVILAVVRPLAAFFTGTLVPAVRSMAETLAKNLQPAFKAISEFVSSRILPALKQLQEAFTKAMPTIIAVGKVIVEVAGFILNVLGKALGFLIPLLLNIIGPIFSALITVISAVISFIPSLAAGFMAVVNVLKIIGEVIAAVVIAPFLAIWEVGKFVFENLVAGVKAFVAVFMAVWNFLWPVTKAVFDLIVAVVSLAFEIITGLFQVFWQGILVIWNALWGFIIQPVMAGLGVVASIVGAILSVIWGNIKEFWSGVVALWNTVWDLIVPPTVARFNLIKDIITGVMDFISDHVAAVWNAIVGFFTTARDRTVNAINNFTVIVDRARAIFQNMKDAAVQKAEELVSWVQGLPGRLLSALGNIGGMLVNAGHALIQGFWDGMKNVWNSMVSWLESKMSTLRGLWPFSPAKWGPFSGRGWVLYSGRALMEGFAEGMDDRVGLVNAAAMNALANVAGSLPTDFSATVGAATGVVGTGVGVGAGSSTTTNSHSTTNNIALNVPLEDLRSIKDVQDLLDFVDRLRNDSRRGLVSV
jgi:TP901 family phage tail tape measure protein